MKNLRVEYNGTVLFDGEVDEFNWTENGGGVTVSGKFRKGSSSGQGLFDMLAGARKQQTEASMAEKRAAVAEEKMKLVEQT